MLRKTNRMENKDHEDGPAAPEVQPAPRKKLIIKMLMAGIATNSLIFGYAATVFPENDQIVKINAKLLGLLSRITEANPSLKLVRSCVRSRASVFLHLAKETTYRQTCQQEHAQQTESPDAHCEAFS